MKANEVALELALYFEECKRIDAIPRIEKLEAMVMQYSPTIMRNLEFSLSNLGEHRPTICDKCNIIFYNIILYDNHLKQCGQEKQWWFCADCDTNFETYERFENHKLSQPPYAVHDILGG